MSLWVPISYLQSGDMTQLGPGKFPYKILHTPLARPYRFMPLVKSVGWYLTSPIPPPHLEFVYVIGFIFPMEKMFSVMTFLRFLVTPTIYDPNYIWFVFSSKSMFYIVVQQPSCSLAVCTRICLCFIVSLNFSRVRRHAPYSLCLLIYILNQVWSLESPPSKTPSFLLYDYSDYVSAGKAQCFGWWIRNIIHHFPTLLSKVVIWSLTTSTFPIACLLSHLRDGIMTFPENIWANFSIWLSFNSTQFSSMVLLHIF